MFKKFLKNYIAFFIAIILLAACEGQDCIQANDFGEYDTDVITVKSKTDECTYVDGSDGNDPNITSCILGGEAADGNIMFSPSGGMCSIELDTGCILSFPPDSKSNSCDMMLLKQCSEAQSSCSLLKDIKLNNKDACGTTVTEGFDQADDSNKSVVTGLASDAYNKAVKKCTETCEKEIGDNFGPIWVSSITKTDDSSTGITISPTGTAEIQAVGNLVLEGSSEESVTFKTLGSKYILFSNISGDSNEANNGINTNNKGVYLDRNITFDVGGSWKSDSGGASFGEKGLSSKNYQNRYEFLRRGVIVLKDFGNYTLEDGKIKDANGNDVSDDEDIFYPNFNKWTCEVTSYNNETYSCTSNSTNFPMNNGFTKTIGGEIIPEGQREFLLANPINNFQEIGGDGENIYELIDDLPTKDSGQLTANILDGRNTGGTASIQGWSVNYPSKIAIKVIPVDNTNDNVGKCTINITHVNNKKPITALGKKTIEIADNNRNWNFLVDENGPIVLNSKYNTLPKDFESIKDANSDDSDASEIEYEYNYEPYSININSECEGAGDYQILAILIPQSEILIEKSGFVSFKKLLNATENPIGENADNINPDYIFPSTDSIQFTIINPMYDYITEHCSGVTNFNTPECSTILEQNFYEYLDNSKLKIETIDVSTGQSNNWSTNDIFVRNGQILRFDDSIWFYYENWNANTKTFDDIKTKGTFINSDGTTGIKSVFNITDGLVMRIIERPALLCKGYEEEVVENTGCNTVTYKREGTGETVQVCRLSHTDYCLDENDTEHFCPAGCYGDFFVDKTLGGTECSITNDSGAGTKESCEKCKELIDSKQREELKNILGSNYNENSYNQDDNAELGFKSEIIEASVIQCYDLENYAGSVRNLTDTSASDSIKEHNRVGESGIDSEQTAVYGGLTTLDTELGAKKLSSIFANDSYYGNLDGMTLDETETDNDKKYKGIYNISQNLAINNPKRLEFFVIDNAEFTNNSGSSYYNNSSTTDYANNGFGSYNGNSGDYEIVFSPLQTVKNGEQLAIVLAASGFGTNAKDPENDSCFVGWVRECDFNTGECFNEPHGFKTNGSLTPQPLNFGSTTGTNYASLFNDAKKKLINSCNQPEDIEFEDLKLYFAIADKVETNNKSCPNSDTQCPNNEVPVMSVDENKCLLSCGGKTYNLDFSCSKVCMTTDKKYCDSRSYHDECFDDNDKFIGSVESVETCSCKNSYANNSGKYSVQVKTPKDVTNATGYIVKYVMEPIINILDGKTIGFQGKTNPTSDEDLFVACGKLDNACYHYDNRTQNPNYDGRFGEKCKYGDEYCWAECIETAPCIAVNDNSGFLQRFYTAVINDSAYQVILKLCFTLMVCFYGMYYLLGMAELTHGELIRRVIKIAFIYLMVGSDGWYYYNMFFVKFFKSGVDYLVFAIAGAFEGGSGNIQEAFLKNSFYDKSVLFSGVDKNLTLIFSDQVSYKIWGLFFVSFFGWLYVFIIYFSVLSYVFAIANAMLLYLTAQFFVSMLLALGPIFFVMLVFEKTKGMFDKWINNLISFSLEQIFLLTCLGIFNTLVYNIIKSVLTYKVCWMPIWSINIPILGSIELMKFWKATSATSPSAAASAVPGLFQILLIYLIADLMKKFIEFSSQVASGLGGGGITTSSLSSGIKSDAEKAYKKYVSDPIKKGAKAIGTKIAQKTIGYETEEDEKKRHENEKGLKKKHREMNAAGRKAAAETQEALRKQNAEARRTGGKVLSEKEIATEMEKASRKTMEDFVKNDSELGSMLKKGNLSADDFMKSSSFGLAQSDSLLGMATSGIVSRIGNNRSSDVVNDKIKSGKSLINDSASKAATKEKKYANDAVYDELRTQRRAEVQNAKGFFGKIGAAINYGINSVGDGAKHGIDNAHIGFDGAMNRADHFFSGRAKEKAAVEAAENMAKARVYQNEIMSGKSDAEARRIADNSQTGPISSINAKREEAKQANFNKALEKAEKEKGRELTDKEWQKLYNKNYKLTSEQAKEFDTEERMAKADIMKEYASGQLDADLYSGGGYIADEMKSWVYNDDQQPKMPELPDLPNSQPIQRQSANAEQRQPVAQQQNNTQGAAQQQNSQQQSAQQQDNQQQQVQQQNSQQVQNANQEQRVQNDNKQDQQQDQQNQPSHQEQVQTNAGEDDN